MADIDRVITGIPLWLMRDYIADCGGRVEGPPPGDHENVETTLTGDGWTATLSPAPDQVVGSLRVGQVRLVMSGTDAAISAAWTALEPRLVRAGG